MASNKTNLQVGLTFQANTEQAKKQIQSLQNELNKLTTSTNISSDKFGLSAVNQAAAELSANLQTAVNVDTGKLDLTKFQKNLQQSGRDIKDYKEILESIGPAGKEVFNNLETAILQSEVPLTKANKLMANLWHSFKQTAKYQFTASIYRGLIGGIQSAYHYAQDLNESLNNIRIVTGQSTEQMAQFAKQANEAARALSVTTTEYTNGALIYYQQGLNDKEVKARTDVTMKLANASGVSAETASQQLTAIWNNFAKGSENLEYFADVMTALGASTASSTSEIAEGLEKFAAIGNTVGLSYEYAASALATVTATTRQSADVVGTAFKTLFARIQDLEVGETLEDGTTLGKYSQALASVGVNIKDANGELKQMDQILEEMAAAWNTISKDQQVALAQTVAGTRQYTQLVALMENWDFMQKNLQTSYDAEGTLQKQADIYAESWEAAQKRVQAAAESIYKSLINDEFFIDITNFVEKLLTGINNLIEGMGGLKVLLPSLISLFTTLFGSQIAASISNTTDRIKDMLGITQRQATKFRDYVLSLRELDTGKITTDNPAGISGSARNQVGQIVNEAQKEYAKILPTLNEYERKIAEAKMDALKATQNQIEANDKIIMQKSEELQKVKDIAAAGYFNVSEQMEFNTSSIGSLKYDLRKGKENSEDTSAARQKAIKDAQAIINDPMANAAAKQAAENLKKVAESRKSWESVAEAIEKVIQKLQDVNTELSKDGTQAKIDKKARTITTRAARFESAVGLQGEFVGTVQNNKWDSQANSDMLNKLLVDANSKISGKGANKYSKDVVKTNEEIKALIETYQKGEPSLEKWEILVKKLNERLEEQSNQLQTEGKKAVQDYERATGTASDKQEQFSDATRGATYELNKQGAAQQAAAAAAEETAESMGVAAERTMSFSEAVTSLAGGIASIISIGRTLSNLTETLFKDKKATKQDKWNAVGGALTSLSITAPRLIKIFSDLSTKVKLGEGLFGKFATKIGLASTASGTATVTFGKLAGTLGWVGAIIAGLVIVGKVVYNEITKDARAAEEAAEKAKELAEAYEEVKEAAQDFKSTSQGYTESVKELEDLVKGSDEYREKLEEINEQARTLIDNNEELAGKWHYDIEGKIIIDDEVLKNLQATINLKAQNSLNENLSGQLLASNTQLKSDLTDLVRSDFGGILDSQNQEQREIIEQLTRTYLLNGQNYGAAIEKLNSSEKELIKDLNVEPYLQKVYKYQIESIEYNKKFNQDFLKFDEKWSDYYNNLGSQTKQQLYTMFYNAQNKKIESAKENKQTEEQNKNVNDSLYTRVDEFLLYLDARMGNAPNRHFNNMNEALESLGNVVDSYKNIFKEYNSDLTIDSEGIKVNGKAIISFSIDNEGRVTASAQDKNHELHYAEGFVDTYMMELLDGVKEEIEKFTPEYVEQQTRKAYDNLKSIFGDEEALGEFLTKAQQGNFDFSGLSYTEYEKLINSEWYDSILQLIKDNSEGLYESLEKVQEKSREQRENQLAWENNYYEDLKRNSSVASEFWEETYTDKTGIHWQNKYGYSEKEIKGITEAIEKAFQQGGKKGQKAVQDILRGSNDPLGLISALDSTDWRSVDIDSLYKQLKLIGTDIDKGSFEKFANQMREAADAAYYLTTPLDKLIANIKEIKDLLLKLDTGSILSPEDYNKLIKEVPELAGKFVYTIDGMIYVGNKEDLNNITSDLMQPIHDKFAQGRADVASVNNNKEVINSAMASNQKDLFAWLSSYFLNNPNGGFNQTAATKAGYDKEAIALALEQYDSDETDPDTKKAAKAILEAYSTQILNLLDSDEYSKYNETTADIYEKYDSVQELLNNWNNIIKENGEIKDDLEENKNSIVKSLASKEFTDLGLDASKLDDYIDKVFELDKALKGHNEEAATAAVAYAKFEKEVAEAGLNVEDWEKYTDYLRETEKGLKNNADAAMKLAKANMLAQKGADSLASSIDKYYQGLNADKGTEIYKNAITGIVKDIAAIYNITEEEALTELENLGLNFWLKNKELLNAVLNNDEKAYWQFLQNMVLAAGYSEETWQTLKTAIEESEINGKINIGANWSEEAKEALTLFGGTVQDKFGNLFKTGADFSAIADNRNKSSSKSKTPKLLEDELDRYHYIKKALEDIERELERVNKVKERAYGAQHLKYLDQEIQYLQEEVGLQDQYLSQIEGYLGKDRGLIAAYGAQFDAQGNIVNYDQMFTANFNKYANADDSTNWENFKKALSKYEETMDLWQEETEKRADLIREILDKKLEGIKYKVDIGLALDDREIKLLEHQLNRLDDAAYDTAAALANIGQQFEQTEEKIDKVTSGIVETLKTIPGITDERIAAYLAGDGHALDGLTIEQGQIELLEEYSDQLLELSDTLKQLHDDAIQRVKDAFDAWGEKIDDHVAKFEHLNNVIDNYQEIIGLLGQKNLGISNEFMREMRNQQIANLQGALDTRTRAKDNLTEQLAEARRRAAEATTDAERKDWEELSEDIEKRLEEATESWQEAWIAALQANKEAFEATMQELVDSFDDYEDELKRYDTAQDRYLETYRQAYELSKLTRDIQNSINDQDSIRAKQELQKLENKINDIKKSGRKISEDELNLLQKEYELRLAEIALEDAQNAKSLVRLQRDNEGNWGYVYTADQDKIAEAQQSYEDKLYEYMRLSDDMADKSSRAILTLNKEMAEALAALDVNAEDYEQKVAEITEFYGQQIDYFAGQYQIAVDSMTDVARASAEKYKPEVVDIIDSDNSGLQTNFNETVLAIIGDLDNLEDAVTTTMEGIRSAYDTTISAFREYQAENEETCRQAGISYEDLADKLTNPETGYFSQIQREAGEVKDSTIELAGEMSSYLGSTLDTFGNFSSKYSEKVELINSANEGLAASIITLETTLQNLDESSLESLGKLTDHVGQVAQQIKEVADSVGASTAAIDDAIDRSKKIKEELDKDKEPHGQYYGGPDVKLMGGPSPVRMLAKMDTGGYTGVWGTSGRLALLHEKELVLNQEDTENILDAVSLIRQITAGTASLATGLGNIGTGLNNIQLNNGSLDQNVNISASFPNVTNHFEIEEAFNNLVNKASQYAFRPATI